MFGLVGPNGAGKSTLMRTIATLQDPDSGSVQLDGLNVLTEKNEVRKVLGYLPQEFGVYPKMSALDLLQHLAVMKGITSSSERKEMVDALLQQTAMRLLCASTTTSRLASLRARRMRSNLFI
ncbi:MAG: ATP-binding cassette domain-containing protein [Candidatus Sulfotelmatobacter sp.]